MPNRANKPPEIVDANVTEATPTKPKAGTSEGSEGRPMVLEGSEGSSSTSSQQKMEDIEKQQYPSSIVFGGQHFQLVKMESPQKVSNKDAVIDEILKVPEVKKTEDRRSGLRLSGLPRCISSKAYRDMVLAKEDAKRKLKEEKEKRKLERHKARAKKIAEKEQKQKEKVAAKQNGKKNGKGAKNAMSGKAPAP